MIGELLGNYRIVAKLGSGSMGVVFLGEHQRLVRRAAIKLLAPHLVRNQHVLQRFFNEALATSVIRHPGIVDVFDCDVDANGRAYMVMEHLEGETLADRLQQEGRLHWRQACLIVRQAAEALGAVHDKGIVHRDLKPENLFLLLDPRDATAVVVKVLDFGVARLLAQDPASRLTMRGVLLGTPEYMCPEQCAGAEVDHRADVYALGCILFEMLGGLPPFVAETVQELISAHQYFPVPPLRDPVEAIPTWLAELLARMLAKEPGERPASMHEVVKVMRAHEATAAPAASPVEARPAAEPAAGAVASRRRSRSGSDWRALVDRIGARRAATTAFALAAALVLVGAIWSARRKPVAGASTANAQTLVTSEVGLRAMPARAADEALMSERPALPAAAATPATTAAPPGFGTVSGPSPRERRPERSARAARPARPTIPARHVDSDGIVDL
jgi:serine/threonine-protein kinase